MAKLLLTGADFAQNQALNIAMQSLPAAPSSPVPAQFYFNSASNRPFLWNPGTSAWEWRATNSDQLNGQAGSYYLALANATGNLAAAQLPAFTGDVVSPLGSSVNTIAATSVSNAKLAQMAPMSFKINNTGSTAAPIDGTAAQTKAALAIVVSDVSGAEQTANKGVASGYASLDGSGKVPTAQLPASVLGAVNFVSTWNASTNTPALASGVGTKGYYYKVNVAGTTSIDGIASWNVGDSIVFDGATWDKIDGITSEVVSVAGRYGVVTLAASDISGLAASATTDTTNASNITSGTLSVACLPVSVMQKVVTAPFGDGSTTSFVFTHGLNTRAIRVDVWMTASPYTEVDCDVNHTSLTTCTLSFGPTSIPTTGQYTALISG